MRVIALATRWPRISSPPLNTSSSTGVCSAPSPRSAWLTSGSPKDGMPSDNHTCRWQQLDLLIPGLIAGWATEVADQERIVPANCGSQGRNGRTHGPQVPPHLEAAKSASHCADVSHLGRLVRGSVGIGRGPTPTNRCGPPERGTLEKHILSASRMRSKQWKSSQRFWQQSFWCVSSAVLRSPLWVMVLTALSSVQLLRHKMRKV